MEASILLQIIKDDIKILNNLAADLSTDTGLTSDEVEIVLARARNVVKELELLKSKVVEKAEPSAVKTSPENLQKIAEKTIELEEEAAPEVKTEEIPKDERQPESKESKEPERTETSSEEKEKLVSEEQEEDSDMELLEVEQENNRTLGESVAAQRSINDLIGEDYKEDSFTNRPLGSIREGISLNDRFLFVRELFGNNSDKFNEAVDKLDRAENIQEAVHFLKSNYKWSKTETSQKFLSLVKRRFLS
ncbi:hypothetical protein [Prolixibacter denitrificans]|uniref:Uncharacterized protein n=1 Tax=Prolixibacter denitrificans TaxID=1541063 RepID=A0A2P8CKC3_9BACT|nr:hypothetical protein [Prolixibacter denitrificans]PSK85424.1 hypothetical protein CLV93_101380 [Prolixibacter denitrificans]GET20045.1 hypothetical protein JCM18694_02910 [Prolixibacter denitrificans]